MILRPALILLATALAGATLASAETVYLKGGGKVQGEIVADGPNGLVLEVGPGQVSIARDRILRIEGGRSPVGEFEARARALSAKDVAGWLALARWADDHDLASQADRAYGHVIATDPDNREAHAGLGHVQVDGRWLSFEDAQRARGLVESDGQWMSPAERDALVRDRILEEVRQQSARESDARAREAEARASEAEAAAHKAETAATGDGGIPIGLVGMGTRGSGRSRHGERARPCARQATGCGPGTTSPTPAPSPLPTPRASTIRGQDSPPPPSRKTSSGTSSVGSTKDRTTRPPSSQPSPKP